MFRKTWKTIRIFLIAAIILICMPHSFLPSKSKREERKRSGTTENAIQASDTLKNKTSAGKSAVKH